MSRPIIATAPISNLATFERALDLTRQTFESILPYWRGHGNVDWSLTAEVFRTPSPGRQHPEVTLIRNFMGRAESRSHRCPAYDDYVGWLMLARHFYLPTRLLDWSMSPLVALFFAVEHHEEVDGALWALHPALLNQSMIGENRVLILDDPPIQELVKLAFNPDPALHQAAAPRVKGWGLAVGAREIDARVMVSKVHLRSMPTTPIWPQSQPIRTRAPIWWAFASSTQPRPVFAGCCKFSGLREAHCFPISGRLRSI